jgi:hypothetical protein
MTPPSWLAVAVAAVMLVIAGYCATRPLAARRWQRAPLYDVDAKHVVMGVAMAGMLVPGLNPLRRGAWAVIFAAGAAWFGGRVLQDRRRQVRAGPAPAGHRMHGHHGAHLLSCAAMVCMLVAPRPGGAGMAAGPGTGVTPVLALLLAVAASVVRITDRVPARVTPAPGGAATAGATLAMAGPPPVLCPRLAASCQILMGVAMPYMLILML